MAPAKAPTAEETSGNAIIIPDVGDRKAEFLAGIESDMEALRPAVDKFEELQALKDQVTGARVNGRPVRRASSTGGGGGSRGVGRAEQLLTAVKDNPGKKIAQYAEIIGGVEPNYLYRVRDGLKTKGKIRVEGDLLYPA